MLRYAKQYHRLVCGAQASPDTYFAGYDKTRVSPISSPDNVAFDRHGNLWISSDSSRARPWSSCGAKTAVSASK